MATDTTEQLSDSNNINSSQLQPRKRAKTSEEKEQRRMERILRNRRAAHKSRERKRFYLNLYQEKSEKYDLLFKSILEAGILETSNVLKNDSSFNKLKDELLDLNKKQEKFERENGTVNSSIPKRDQNNSDDEDEDEESIAGESHEQEKSANESLEFQDEQPEPKKRKFNSRKDSSSTVFSSNSTTPTSNLLPKFEESEEFIEESNYSKTFLTPSNSITTIKNNNDHVLSNQHPNNSKINPLDLSLELGIDLEEPVYNNNLLLDPEVDDLLIMQRYPAVITF